MITRLQNLCYCEDGDIRNANFQVAASEYSQRSLLKKNLWLQLVPGCFKIWPRHPDGLQGFPTELSPRVIPCCVVSVFIRRKTKKRPRLDCSVPCRRKKKSNKKLKAIFFLVGHNFSISEDSSNIEYSESDLRRLQKYYVQSI